MNYETPMAAKDYVPAGSSEGFASGHDGSAEPRGTRKWLWIAIAILVGLAAVIAYLTVTADDGVQGPAETDLQLVTVAAPGAATIAGRIEATGTLAARRPIPVGAVGEGGRVTNVTVDAGDWVRQGQVLVAVDAGVQQQQIRSARANIEVARADASLAQANLDRAMKLVERGFVSQADIDRLTATRDAARARVDVARAQVGELQARTSRLNVYAPASGLVLERMVEPGQTISAGTGALFTIARGGEMEMRAELGEAELAQLSVGVEATVTPVGTDRTFTGQVWQLAPTIDEQDRQGTARIALPYDRDLRPGGFASATIESGTIVAPKLPESAIQSDNDGSYVYIVDAQDKVVRRRVKTGLVTADGIAITDGLDGSERVVLFAGGFLNEGETVRVRVAEAADEPTG